MSNISIQLANVFAKTIPKEGVKMDGKMLTFWSNAINRKEKTLADFERFLLQTNDYVSAVNSVFIDIYSELLGFDPEENHKMYEEFVAKHEGAPVSKDTIRHFIVSSAMFQKQYRDLISRLFQAFHEKEPTDHEIEMFLDKFQTNETYDMDSLRDDIEQFGKQNDDGNRDDDAHDDAASVSLDCVQNILADDENANSTFFIVDTFENKYQRSMNVREYVLYIKELYASYKSGGIEDLEKKLETIYSKHKLYFAQVSDITNSYLGKKITENEFIKRYLSKTDEQSFAQDLKDAVIDSEEYKEKMTTRIRILFDKMYDEDLTDEDCEYLFNNLKSKSYTLVNEEINNDLVAFKDETDTIVQHIFEVFINTFEREPDKIELAYYIRLYRKHLDEGFDTIGDMVEKELQESLEYHDVIKRKIKSSYMETHKTSILPSMVYSILQKVLEKKGKNSVEDVIKELVVCQ